MDLRRLLPLAPLAFSALLAACGEYVHYPVGEPLGAVLCFTADNQAQRNLADYFKFENGSPSARAKVVQAQDFDSYDSGCDVWIDGWKKVSDSPQTWEISLLTPPLHDTFLTVRAQALDGEELGWSIIARGVYEALKSGTSGAWSLTQRLDRVAADRRAAKARAADAKADLRRLLAEADDELEHGRVKKAFALYQQGNALAKQAVDLENTRGARVGLIRCAAKLGLKLPDEVRARMVKSQYILKRGGSPSDAAEEIAQAVQLAPWWLDGYFNLGMARALEGKYEVAINDLHIYIDAAPDGPRVRQAKDKLAELEVEQEQAARLARLSGDWQLEGTGYMFSLDVAGDRLTASGTNALNPDLELTGTLKRGRLDGSLESKPLAPAFSTPCGLPGQQHPVSGTISSDGASIELEYAWTQYQAQQHDPILLGTAPICDGIQNLGTSTVRNRLVLLRRH